MPGAPDDSDDPTAAPVVSTGVTAVDKPAGHDRSLATEELASATRIDRFLILEKLGEGGMGSVYAAYDTLLDRKVAIKVVRPHRSAVHPVWSPRERLLREAQAMARLHHPNVVAVLDVGELGENVYLALELVDGQTLKAWLREARQPWRTILATFVEAGRGLAAAHAAGLVHRDVKPDNILVGKDGRIQVTDFGVVSMQHGRRGDSDSDPKLGEGSDEDTLSGLRVGTPAYSAPEQFAGESVDARADQFSFCVALWEGLFGERPFGPLEAGTSFAQRPLREVPRDADVPGWLIAAVRRGLAVDARARWPSMDALLAELTKDRSMRRRIVIGAAIACVLGASLTLAFLGWTRDREAAASPCKDEARHLAGVWDAAQADALAARLRATGAPTADATARRVRDHFEAWTRDWVEQRTAACAATRIHGDQSEAMLDMRMRCLDRRLVRVRELVHAIGALERADVGRAIEITSDLPDLRACAEGEPLTAAAPAPTDPVLRGRVEEIEQELARVVAVEQTGRYPAALALARPLVNRAASTRYEPIRAEALAAVGRLQIQIGEYPAGIAALREAAALAAAAHADDVAANALLELVTGTADAGRGAEALAVAAAVAPMITRAHDPALEALLAVQVGDAYVVAGELAAATTELERALALTEAALGRDHIRVAQVLNRLGGVEDRKNHPAEARAYYSRALAIAEARVGPDHPSVAVTRANLCYLDHLAGRLNEAASCYEQVIATLEAALGAEHPQVAWALNDAGLVEQARGRLEQARADWERSRAIYERTSGAPHPDIAWPLVNLGGLALRTGDSVRSEALCRRALAVIGDAAGSDHGSTFDPLVCLGASLAERRPAEANALLEKALHMDEAEYEPDARGNARFALARAAAARGDRARAETNAREALAALSEPGTSATDRAEVAAWMKRQHIAVSAPRK